MKINPRTILYLILIALCITGAITGSFFDLQISEKIYIGDSLPAKLISFYGICFLRFMFLLFGSSVQTALGKILKGLAKSNYRRHFYLPVLFDCRALRSEDIKRSAICRETH
jgi:ABC-type microcin C transport system permease subunit YejB